jgi:hypothetical protein
MLKFNQLLKDIIGLDSQKSHTTVVEAPTLTKEEIDSTNASLFLTESNQEKFSELISSGYKATHQDLDKLLQNIHYNRMQLTQDIKEYIHETFESLNSFYKEEFTECTNIMKNARVLNVPNDFSFDNFEKISSLVHVAVRINALDSNSKTLPTEKVCSNEELYSFYTKAHSFLYVCHYDSEYRKKYETYTDFNSYKAMDVWCAEDGLKLLDNHEPAIKFKIAVENVNKLREQSNSNSNNLKLS